MKNLSALIIAVVVLIALVFFTFAYVVRYDRIAVVTTFGAADQASVRREAGIYFKWPPPIQRVYAYPRQLQILEGSKVEIQTADNIAVIPATYVVWRVDDPLAFYRAHTTIAEAEEKLKPLIRGLSSVISSKRFDQMVNNDPSKVELDVIEEELTAALRKTLAEQAKPWGIAVEHFGIRRLVLPEQTTEKVFERMRTTRQLMAQDARSSGEAEAKSIVEDAKAAKEKILAFAESRAQSIRARGDNEAEIYLAEFRKNEEFATFLFQIEALKKMLANNTTFVLDADDLDVLRLFKGDGFNIEPKAARTGESKSQTESNTQSDDQTH